MCHVASRIGRARNIASMRPCGLRNSSALLATLKIFDLTLTDIVLNGSIIMFSYNDLFIHHTGVSYKDYKDWVWRTGRVMAAHRLKTLVGHVVALVTRHLQRVRKNRHLERIGDVHDLCGQVVGSTASCRIHSLFRFLYSIFTENHFFFSSE